MDKGPWQVSKDGVRIYSDDFTHDVALVISGDFIDGSQRYEYAKWLAKTLNEAPRECSACGDYFKPAKAYYHRCNSCQKDTYNEEEAYYYDSDFDEDERDIDGYDLNVDWYK